MKSLKTFVAILSLVAVMMVPVAAVHADDTAVTADQSTLSADATTTVTVNPDQAQLDELATLQAREENPNTGIFMKLFLKFKINQLKNQLTIKKALQ